MKIRLTKLKELPDALHPKNIEEGYIKEGDFVDVPHVGKPFCVGSFRTSYVCEIIDQDTFKTCNSIYKWIAIESKLITTIERKAIEHFNEKFGTEKSSRFRKVQEEFNELESAIIEGDQEHIKDEISDLYATVTHLASLYDLHHTELLEMALDKVSNRENNPDYKRFRLEKV